MRDLPVPSFVRPVADLKGKVYARPMGTTPSVMMDNMSLLKRLGLKRPETFERNDKALSCDQGKGA